MPRCLSDCDRPLSATSIAAQRPGSPVANGLRPLAPRVALDPAMLRIVVALFLGVSAWTAVGNAEAHRAGANEGHYLSADELRALIGPGVRLHFVRSDWSPEFYCDGTYAYRSHPANEDGYYTVDDRQICFFGRKERCFAVWRSRDGELTSINPFLAAAGIGTPESLVATPAAFHRCGDQVGR